MNSFWITERGEISYQLEYAKSKLEKEFKTGDALLIITKNIDNKDLSDFLLDVRRITILHVTITGYGGSLLEPGVSIPFKTISALNKLIENGFPVEQIVLRIDPIIPTKIGMWFVEQIIKLSNKNINRLRFSFIDNYKHVNNLLNWQCFNAPLQNQNMALKRLYFLWEDKYLEACGELSLRENTGCISVRDYDILGMKRPEIIELKGQRKSCMCLSTKKELLVKQKCPNKCVYCYYNLY